VTGFPSDARGIAQMSSVKYYKVTVFCDIMTWLLNDSIHRAVCGKSHLWLSFLDAAAFVAAYPQFTIGKTNKTLLLLHEGHIFVWGLSFMFRFTDP